jgi:hypothetical protein
VQFAVMYEARANSGIDRMKIINSVAKCVPGPHKVDLSNPDKTIVVEIVKVRICSLPCHDLSFAETAHLLQNQVLRYFEVRIVFVGYMF